MKEVKIPHQIEIRRIRKEEENFNVKSEENFSFLPVFFETKEY